MNADWTDVRRLLVIRPDNIGDVLLAAPTIRALKAALPGARLTMLVSKAGEQAVPLVLGIDDTIVARPAWQELGDRVTPEEERALIARLAETRFDAAVILTSFSQSPHPPALACILAGIPLRLGESSERAEGLLTHRPASPTPRELYQAERNMRLLAAIGIEGDDRVQLTLPDEASAWASQYRDAIVLVPFASCAARTYDPARAAAAALALARATGTKVLLTGALSDAGRAAPLRAILGERGIDLTGATDLPRFAALIAGARLVITNNTSALHLADAFETPVLVTYAGTDLVSQWAPRFAAHTILRRGTACTPCGLLACPIGQPCLDVPVDEVVEAGLGLLGATSERKAA